MLLVSSFLFGQVQSVRWVPETFESAVLSTLVFGAIGIVLAIGGFKLFDLLTPGKLDEEIIQKQNMPAAVIGAAIILGICIIVASAIHG
jgi:uncharacterized membrane protein YjfL (UPF0719 family)